MVDRNSKSFRQPRPSEAQLGERKWLNEMLMGGMRGCSFSESALKEFLLDQVEQAIDEKLATLKDGQGLGIVFKISVTDHTGRVEGSPRDLRNDEMTREWRDVVLRRDRYTCQKCESKEDLHAHHIKDWATHPESRLDIANGVTLCVRCHAESHPEIKDLILSNVNRKKRKGKTVKADTTGEAEAT